MSTVSANEMPLRIGDKADFARVAHCLKAAGFNETEVCRALKIERLSTLGEVKNESAQLKEVPELLALFIRLFLLMDLMPRAEVERLLNQGTLDAFLALDLIRIGEYGKDQYYTPIFLYPVVGLLIVSDRHTSPDLSPYTPPDVVFPAIFAGTLQFLRLIPQSVTGDVLDLCSGSGVAAILLSRHARRTVASDITERAAHFARFNAMLNDCPNLETRCGDLFAAVEGETFDRITAHPPYMPAPRAKVLWRDGGDTGEFLLRRIIEGLPQFLRPGGTACTVSLGLDTEEAPFEVRARKWLGEANGEFDIIFGLIHKRTTREILEGLSRPNTGLGKEDIKKLAAAFEREKTSKLVYGALVLHRRRDQSAEPWTTRVQIGEETEGADFEWAFKWHQRRLQPNFLEELAEARPRLAPRMRVQVTHVVHEGELVPADFVFESDKPFLSATRFDGDVVGLVMQFNGQITPAELYAKARADSSIPDQVSREDFVKMVATVLDYGYLVLDDMPHAANLKAT